MACAQSCVTFRMSSNPHQKVRVAVVLKSREIRHYSTTDLFSKQLQDIARHDFSPIYILHYAQVDRLNAGSVLCSVNTSFRKSSAMKILFRTNIGCINWRSLANQSDVFSIRTINKLNIVSSQNDLHRTLTFEMH